jgi:hypothetical protein
MKVFALNPYGFKKLNNHENVEWNKTEPFLKYIYERVLYAPVERDLFYLEHLFGSNPVKTEMTNFGDSV